MSNVNARIARNKAIARSGIKLSHPDHPGHERWLEEQYKRAKKRIRKLQADLTASKKRIKYLEGGVELAIDYLPECPDKAKSFLEGAQKGKAK